MVPSLRRLDRPQAGMEHPRDPCRAARSPDLAPVGMKASRGRTMPNPPGRDRGPPPPKQRAPDKLQVSRRPYPVDFTLSERQIPKQSYGNRKETLFKRT